jgi:DNA-binding Lrp family transcriptional regulator
MPPESLDWQLVAALRRDGRRAWLSERLAADSWKDDTVRALADATDTPATTVQRRLRELEESDTILGYEPRLDYEALGYALTVVVRLEVDGPALDDVCARLTALSGIVDVYQTTGPENVVAVGRFRDRDALDARLGDLLTDPDVRTVRTDVVRETICDHEHPGEE